MKIFLVGPSWFGNITDYFLRAAQQLGCETRVFYTNRVEQSVLEQKIANKIPAMPFTIDEMLKRHLHERTKWKTRRIINQTFIDQALSFSPDLVLMLSGFGNLISCESLIKVKDKLSVPLVTWYIDDPFPYYENTKSIFCSDNIYIGDPVLIPQIKLMTSCPVQFMPGAADLDTFHPVELSADDREKYACEVGYVGGVNYKFNGMGLTRAKVLQDLTEYDLRIFGNPTWKDLLRNDFPELLPYFKGGPLPVSDTNKVYSAAKVVLNIHHPELISGINTRTFEIAAAGGFQLADKKAITNDIFEIGKEIICFESAAELKSLVKHYLNHPEERKVIVQRARNKILDQHTYLHRVKKILEPIVKNA